MSAVFWTRCLWIVGLLAVFFSGKFIYVTLYSLLILFLLAKYATRHGFATLSVQRRLAADRVFRGEDAEVTLTAHNPSWVPLVHIAVNDEVPLNLPPQSPRRAVFALAPGQRVSFRYTVRARYRGVYHIGPLELDVSDPWGVESIRGRIDSYDEVVVYPKVLPLEQLGLPSSLPFGEVRTKHRFFEDPSRTTGIREYQPGDPLKRMHWKVSARTGTLHIREFQPTIALETYIFLNLHDGEYEVQFLDRTTEFAIEVAASLAYYLHRQRQTVGLITNGRDGGPLAGADTTAPIRITARKGAGQLMRIMETLARVQVQQGKEFRACLTDEARSLPWGSTLLIVTPEDTPEIVEALFALRRAGYLLMVLLVGERVQHPAFLGAPPLPGLTFFRVRHEGELSGLSAAQPA